MSQIENPDAIPVINADDNPEESRITLNSCVNWDTENTSLSDVHKWNSDMASKLSQIEAKKKHIKELQAQKVTLLNANDPSTNDEIATMIQAKQQELNEIENNSMRRVFWRKRIDELNAEIDELQSRKACNSHKVKENYISIDEINRQIKTEEDYIRKYSSLVKDSESIFEDLKKDTRMRTGVPFEAVDIERILAYMNQRVEDNKLPAMIEIQIDNNSLMFMVDVNDKGDPIFGAVLNDSALFDETNTDDEIKTRVQALYTTFTGHKCKMFCGEEKPIQAMQGQSFNKNEMEQIYEVVGKISQTVENLSRYMNQYYRAMNLPMNLPELPADAMPITDDIKVPSDEPVASSVTRPVHETPAKTQLKTYVQNNNQGHSRPVQQPKPQVQPKPVQQVPLNKNGNQPVGPVPQQHVQNGPRPQNNRPQPQKPSPFAEQNPKQNGPTKPVPNQNQSKNDRGYATAILYQGNKKDNKQPVNVNAEDSNLSFDDFQHKYESEKLKNLEKSKKTVREEEIDKIEQNK